MKSVHHPIYNEIFYPVERGVLEATDIVLHNDIDEHVKCILALNTKLEVEFTIHEKLYNKPGTLVIWDSPRNVI